MQIALLFEPSADRTIPFAAGPERYQRLADEVGRYAGAKVQIVQDVLRKAPADTYVLFAGSGDVSRSLADCGPVLAAQLASRLVLLDVSWQKALEQLEKHCLAGAVDSLRLSEWLARPSSCTGPFGLRYLTKPLGASCVPLPGLHSAHYCLLQSKQHRGMPHLLADYLVAYDRDLRPLSALQSVSLARVQRVATEGSGSAQTESVGIKRVIDSLKRAREFAHMTLRDVSERSGFNPQQLGLLEGSDYSRATLGALRAYFLALESSWGWTLAESTAPLLLQQQRLQEQMEAATMPDQPLVVSGIRSGVTSADFLGSSPLPSERPWVFVERGMTFLGNRRIRCREENSHAGI